MFVTRDVPARCALTFYEGSLTSPPDRKMKPAPAQEGQDDYDFEIPAPYAPAGEDGWIMEGMKPRQSGAAAVERTLWGRGLAQMVNDAIHPEATGRSNNCDFVFFSCDDGTTCDIFVVTNRAIPAGTELLAPYGLTYWLARTDRFCVPEVVAEANKRGDRHGGKRTNTDKKNKPPDSAARCRRVWTWLRCHQRVSDVLRRVGVEVLEYQGWQEGGVGEEGENKTGRLRYLLEGDWANVACNVCKERGENASSSTRYKDDKRGPKWRTVILEEVPSTGSPLVSMLCPLCEGRVTRHLGAA